jgi:crotonobetainyl-CoA:carnitine CoA-transferase CaiB-like acyl-CoA transferase
MRPTAEWERRLAAAGVPHAVVRDYPAVFADEQVRHRGMALTVTDPAGRPVELVGSPFGAFGVGEHRSPPRLGADTAAVLEGLGLSAERVAGLRAAGVV